MTRPRLAVASDGTRVAIDDGSRVTIVEDGEAVATVELPGPAEVGWIGTRLVVIAGDRARIVSARGELIEHVLAGPMHLFACVDEVALVAGDAGAALVTGAGIKPVRVRPALAGAAPGRFLVVHDSAIVEWDTAGAPKRTWRVPAGETITALGATGGALWRTTREAPQRIAVIPLIARGQPRTHELPAPIVQVAAHPALERLACLDAEGRVQLVGLAGGVRTLATSPIERPVAIALARADDWQLVACASDGETIRVPLTRRSTPTWREQVVAWTRSGIVDVVPSVPPIERLARTLALPDGLVPALVLCYGAHLCGAPGVPPAELDELLAGKWPEEIAGTGQLARARAAIYVGGWVALAPEHCRTLDDAD